MTPARDPVIAAQARALSTTVLDPAPFDEPQTVYGVGAAEQSRIQQTRDEACHEGVAGAGGVDNVGSAGINVRRPAALRAWLSAYAAATATTAGYTKILDAATAGDPDKPARNTFDGYREHLHRLFLLDPVEAWTPSFVPLKRLTNSVKHHLVDPGLAARLVGVGAEGLLVGEGEAVSPRTGTWLGVLFESLAVQTVRVYADAMGARVGHTFGPRTVIVRSTSSWRPTTPAARHSR